MASGNPTDNFPYTICVTFAKGVIMWFDPDFSEEKGLLWVTDYLENGINKHCFYYPEKQDELMVAQRFAELNDWGQPKITQKGDISYGL